MPVRVLKGFLKIDDIKNNEINIEKTKIKFKGRLRWNLVINFIVLGIMGIPFFTPILVTFIVNAYFMFLWFLFILIATVKHFRIHHSMNKYRKISNVKNDRQRTQNVSEIKINQPIEEPTILESKYKYIMATFAYKEPIGLLIKSINNISSIYGSHETIILISLEERTPDLEYKISSITNIFESKFREIIITVHPYGVEGEIPGKCSNSNYGIRQLYSHLKETQIDFKPNDYIITNFDVDTLFDKNFLNILKHHVNKTKYVDKVVWQPLLYYNWDFNRLSFFTRIIGIIRSTMMAGALTTFNINIMSVYSASLKLYIDGNYVHPFYQMDDIICYIRWMIVCKNYIKIKSIYSATISGPTSGENMFIELKELIRQSQRWAIGSAEVFHYFIVKIKKINILIGLMWGFNYLNYYACFLCAQGLLSITTLIRLLAFDDNENVIKGWFFILPLIAYFLNLWMIFLNKLAVYTFLKRLDVKEHIDSIRECIHWILSVPTQICYSFIVFYGFFVLIVAGKNVCKHGASRKDALKF